MMNRSEVPDINSWLREAAADPKSGECGMYLVHCGVVRATPRAWARRDVRADDAVGGLERAEPSCCGVVRAIDFSADLAAVEQALCEVRAFPGVGYARVWLAEGVLEVGEPLMYAMVGADIRPRCIAALEWLVERIKTGCVIEKELFEER